MFPPSEDGILRGHCPENFKSHVIIIYIFIWQFPLDLTVIIPVKYSLSEVDQIFWLY
jgi:hypothetical protein